MAKNINKYKIKNIKPKNKKKIESLWLLSQWPQKIELVIDFERMITYL